MHRFFLFFGLAVLLEANPLAQTVPGSPIAEADKPRVFITDSQSWEYISNAGGSGGAFASHGSGGARPQTAEIVKTFGERCPQVITNNKVEKSDYVVVLDHEGGKGLLRHKNKIAVFNRVSGDSIVSHSTLSLGGSVQDGCEAITKDWSAHSKEIRAAAAVSATPALVPAAAVEHIGADAPPPVSAAVAAHPAAQSSTSAASLQISSAPDGADIEIDGSYVGSTPSTVGVASGSHEISMKKAGFKPWERKISVSSGQVNVNAALEAETK